MKYVYSKELADIVKSYLDSLNASYKFDEDNGTISFCTKVDSKIKQMYYRIVILNDSYIVVGNFDLNVNDENCSTFVKYLTKINFYSGANFVIDLDKKEVYGQRFTICTEITPTAEIVEGSIFSVLAIVERYGDILVDISEGKEPSEEALEKLLEE